ncbi:MAG: DoxX family protein [bacterium]
MPHLEARFTHSTPRTVSVSKRVVAGRIISGLAILFMIFDGGIKLTNTAVVAVAFAQLGYPVSLAPAIGILALLCTAVYALPRASVFGAVLLTGYLGGAIATQVRAGSSTFSVFFPVIIGALVWGGLALRDDRLSEFLPGRRARATR